jgi:hypothetical protein
MVVVLTMASRTTVSWVFVVGQLIVSTKADWDRKDSMRKSVSNGLDRRLTD